ncbi:hydroxypyruvate reductase [Actinomycetospora sp. NBRC 106375]|uniref:glycerate kinase type-2 family protein n=1 Tax=Actinomycetospora sp. NBRC 106375 TaxID=3032207 RepID=UPI0024A55642|nr:DUF4147 domain-containing protein [Actinomycetospora sp. NBRC 106375]GLZ50125.1 hydroxypyruvate reductase [Actinomycetospora sp. NBRC 106375]
MNTHGDTAVAVPAETLLRRMFTAAVTAADPGPRVPEVLGTSYWDGTPTLVLGAGKAAARMARSVELAHRAAGGHGTLRGAVVTRYGHRVACGRIEVHEAAHPVSDGAGVRATRRLLDLARAAGPGERVLGLVSGGASALLAAPAPGLTLEDEQAVAAGLLASGAPIDEINLVRRHLSEARNGGLARACAPAPARVLLISDVPGDDPATIGSGPFLAGGTTRADAAAVLARRGITVPSAVDRHLAESMPAGGRAGERTSGCAPDVRHEVIAAPRRSLEAAAEIARAAGVTPVILGDAWEGESREVGRVLAGIAAEIRRHGRPATPPCVLLTGGETTVTLRGRGVGGPNVELLLAFALAAPRERVWAVAGDTDGVDGAAEVAGAVVTPDTLARAEHLGLDARAALSDNDGHAFFAALGDQVLTGPTLTNVNDFRAVLVS